MPYEAKVLTHSVSENPAAPPLRLGLGEWHLPYVSDQELEAIRWVMCYEIPGIVVPLAELIEAPVPMSRVYEAAIRLSVARCARVSYLTHEGGRPAYSLTWHSTIAWLAASRSMLHQPNTRPCLTLSCVVNG